MLCAGLVALAVAEYAVAPPALWRDVLPTAAHRWIMRQPGRVRALDCAPLDQESRSVEWLTGNRVTLLPRAAATAPNPTSLRSWLRQGITHLLVRRRPRRQWLQFAAMDGLRLRGELPRWPGARGDVAEPPALYTAR